MKNNFLTISLISAICGLFLSFTSCINDNSSKPASSGFVTIKDKTFKLDGKDFYPMILNYGVNMNYGNGEMWACPAFDYMDPKLEHTKEAGLKQFKADMQMIKDLGFNCVRLGLDYQVNADKISIWSHMGNSKDSSITLTDETYKIYFKAVSEIWKIFNAVGLKAVVLMRKNPEIDPISTKHYKKMLMNFSEEPAIMAYDFFNEPLYFDKPERKKEEVNKIVKRWKKFIRRYAPNQLLTIGLTGVREVFEWDPNLLDVDFVSIHPYEFQPGEVENEIYWYYKYMKKPWIIGETGFSANNDSVKYEVQQVYAKKFLDRALNCRAMGFSWWQYKDVEWYEYQSNFLGLVTQTGTTKTSDPNLVINGTPKPASREIKKFDPWKKPAECSCLTNFYNYSSQNKYLIVGKLFNKTNGRPIVGGPVVAWDEFFSKSNLTYTKVDGSFRLYANYKLYYFIASATLMDSYRTNFIWDNISVKTDSIPTYNIGSIGLNPLNLD